MIAIQNRKACIFSDHECSTLTPSSLDDPIWKIIPSKFISHITKICTSQCISYSSDIDEMPFSVDSIIAKIAAISRRYWCENKSRVSWMKSYNIYSIFQLLRMSSLHFPPISNQDHSLNTSCEKHYWLAI